MPTATTDPRAWRADTIDDPSRWYYRSGDVAAVKLALEHGRGFAIVEGPADGEQEQRALYWAVGQALGEPFAQNVEGVLLYDVRDTGRDVAQGARFSVTNYESSFHTDNSFGDTVLDYVGLL